MNITQSLQGVTRLFLDTAPIIYAVERNPLYLPLVTVVFEHIFSGLPMGVTSPITLAECLVQPYRLRQTKLQQEFIELITDNENIEFATISNPSLALQAAEIRAKYNLQLPDAFQVAVALVAECEAFLTNDVTFRRLTELRIILLGELEIT